MSRFRIHLAVFAAGLAAIGWVAAGYVLTNPLALAVTLIIGACYVAGAIELQRYERATQTLSTALESLSGPPVALADWIDTLHPSLRGAVRLRVEGERAVLPGPSLTPYLVGLLVLLGMLGTLLGMVATLRGTGLALDSATDLQAVRASLAAPVKGLGFAFGTSIAGVASSAMLGLLSALCRRDRIRSAQQLEARIATTLRPFSLAHQREQTLTLLQQQANWMPTLVDRFQSMMDALEQRNASLNERQLATQVAFQEQAQAAYARLATSVEQSLKASVAENARVVGLALQPVMEATMEGLARETASLRETVSQAVQRQLDGLSSGFEAVTVKVADTWRAALTEQEQSSQARAGQVSASLEQFAGALEQRAVGVLDGLSARVEAMTGTVSQVWSDALAQQAQTHDALEQRAAGVLDGLSARVEAMTEKVSQVWSDALAQQAQTHDALALRNEQALSATASGFERETQTLLTTVRQSHTEWEAVLTEREAQRLVAWREALSTVVDQLGTKWDELGARTAAHQQSVCETLEQTAQGMTTQFQEHARNTIAEIERLVQVASEAPRAAAEVMTELRQKLSDSMVRDTAMLEERTRLLQTVDTLLGAIHHTSTEQRAAIEALVNTSSDLLERIGTRVSDTIEGQARKLDDAAADITGSAVEVASVGEAFGAAVQLFSDSNDKLATQLQRIETALDKSAVRNDEQLAYYVAQAREVIDLCMLSQKHMIDEIQALAVAREGQGDEPA